MTIYYEEKSRRSSYTSKYSATSMTSIAEDEDNADDTLLDSRRGSNVDGGPLATWLERRNRSGGPLSNEGTTAVSGDGTRSELSHSIKPGEMVCGWKSRRGSAGSILSIGEGSSVTFDDSYADGSLICGFHKRGDVQSTRSGGGEEEMKTLKINGKNGSLVVVAEGASSSLRKKGAAKNPYLQF